MARFAFDWDSLKSKLESEEKNKKKKFEKDTRFWSPDKKAESGLYIIRFLPDLEGNPFVKVYSHSFKYQPDGAVKYYIKNCINTHGYDKECPICKKNMEYFNSSFKSDQDLAKQRGRRLKYISNVLIIKDPTNPDNDGKTFLYEYGQKVYDKIKALMFPSDTDLEDPDFKSFIPFDLYEGADFKLKIKQQGEFPNYDDSSFSMQKPVGDDNKIEKIMKSTYKLDEFLADDRFPTNEAVIKEIGDLLGLSNDDDEDEAPKSKPKKEAPKKEKPPVDEDEDGDEESSKDGETTEIDEDAEFFKSLK